MPQRTTQVIPAHPPVSEASTVTLPYVVPPKDTHAPHKPHAAPDATGVPVAAEPSRDAPVDVIATRDFRDELIAELIAATDNLGAMSDLAAITHSYRDTLDDDDVLAMLREWNARGPVPTDYRRGAEGNVATAEDREAAGSVALWSRVFLANMSIGIGSVAASDRAKEAVRAFGGMPVNADGLTIADALRALGIPPDQQAPREPR